MGGAQGDAARDCQVGPEVLVKLEYRLFDAEDALVEAPGPEEGIEFIFGVGQAPPRIEQAVEGLHVGESRRVRLRPNEAFGARDEQAVISVDRRELPDSAKLGDEFEAEAEDGAPVFLRVVEIDDEVAHLDANHPLAGQSVSLELSVLSTRIATSAELRAAETKLRAAEPAVADGRQPDVLVSELLRRNRPPPRSSG